MFLISYNTHKSPMLTVLVFLLVFNYSVLSIES